MALVETLITQIADQALREAIALEVAETGITCNAICPDWVRTELVEAQIRARAAAGGIHIEQAAYDLLADKQPAKRFVTPGQIGEITGLPVFRRGEQHDRRRAVGRRRLDGAVTAP